MSDEALEKGWSVILKRQFDGEKMVCSRHEEWLDADGGCDACGDEFGDPKNRNIGEEYESPPEKAPFGSTRVDCANCDNYPMKKVQRQATGGIEPYYECSQCGNSVRVI
jgi:hypothetical protein